MASLEGRTVQSRRTFLKVAGGAAVTAASLSALACGDDEDEGSGQQSELEPKRGGVLLMTVGHAVSNEKLDPALQAAQNDWIYSSQVFEGLTNYDTDFNPVPVLATEWEVSDDVKSYTFHLREGVKFSDGSPFTAKDAAYTFKTVLDPELGSQLAGTLGPFLDPTGLHVVDDLTLRMDLKEPFAELPVVIGGVPGGIVKEGSRPITSVDKAIGTGAFKFKSFKPGQSWELTRNEFYWDDKLPYLDGVRTSNITDPSSVVRALVSGNAHVAGTIGFGSAKQVESQQKLVPVADAAFAYVAMDQRQKPFDDRRVVQACQLVVDRERALNSAFGGTGALTSDILYPEGFPDYPPDLGVHERDLERARSLLSEAGHSDGIDVELFTSPSAGGMVEYATIYAEMAAEANIRVKITQSDPGSYWQKIWLQEPMYISYSSNLESYRHLAAYHSSSAVWAEMGWSDENAKAIDAFIADAVKLVDAEERSKIYQQAWQHVADNGSYSVASTLPYLYGAKKNVQLNADNRHIVRLKDSFIT